MKISLQEAAGLLKEKDNILILSHQFPDGDTLGTAGALCLMLRSMGKRARMECSDKVPDKYNYMLSDIPDMEFVSEYIVAVDVADTKLLGEPLASRWADKINLCIDHHGSNKKYAEKYYVDPTAAATAEIIYRLAGLLGVSLTKHMADCIYTGITTDTGCFRNANVTAETHLIASELLRLGASAAEINRLMFETKSHSRLALEKMVLETLEYDMGGSYASIYITKAMMKESGASEGDMEGLAPIPRKIEGVKIGVTLREKSDGSYKVSLRTDIGIDASKICGRLGGGGHPQASGCTVKGPLEQAKAVVRRETAAYLKENGIET